MTPVGTSGYRADIDGLRALAVLPVVLYHARVPGFSGGFVGVDIFFVISGFLITGIIAREVDEGRFSVWSFYERRARRILPALFVMVAAVLVAASFFYLPGDFEDVPKSALAALFFLGNVWFFSQTGYFQGAAETMPLLHTWSLGVEEQFYIVFPLALLGIALFARRWRVALVSLLALGSLGWAVATQGKADGFAFYMLPPRAWELLAGSLLALGAVPAIGSRPLREALSWLGIALIAYAVFAYDKATVFPGLAAIPPVLGAALLIHCAPGTSAGRLLAWKPAVWIGLLSYSLYLWHWPIIVFTEYAQAARVSGWQSIAIVAASLLIAWASLVWVETPWRDRRKVSRQRVFAFSAAGLGGLGAACLALIAAGPWDTRFPARVGAIAAAAQDRSPVRDACLVSDIADKGKCRLGADTEPDSLLWGDSHGVEFAWVLGQKLGTQGRALSQRTFGSCAPILDFAASEDSACGRFNEAVIAEIERTPSIRTVYLSAYWASGEYRDAAPAATLDATIARLERAGRKVVLIGAVPKQAYDVPRALQRAAAYGLPNPTARPASEHARDSAWLARQFDEWRSRGVVVIDPAEALIAGNRSRITVDGMPLYFDSHHLTLAGARLVLDTHDKAHRGESVWHASE
ncbi:acyltransferase family protein [Qipengyuania flava]|uniref:acyltransferase family protein n=1 Tax=Qipengyuania flava TaxID=192812 RepID=UPI001C635831|nr:acyltransferase family protein [Qipengyuania flava]QYJ06957.1 acyltransferase [Qipengyuania flava]